jgi:apolipoprotein N-acyltransferase
LARKHKVALVVGYFDIRRNDNRMAFFAANGKWIGEYVKSHLIPVFEKYRAGSGRPTTVRFGRWKVGGLICQDDNFTDIARAYGRRAVSIIAVPTNDWAQVKHHHLENTIFRAVENRFAMVRAATNGISALISPRGRVLARVDHFAAGPAVITARMQLMPATTTLYAWAGDWLAAVCAVFLVMLIVVRRRKTARESSSADKDASTSRALCAKNLR